MGDAAMMAVSLYIVVQAWRLGTTWSALAKMTGWVIVDFLLGNMPVAGDLADALFQVDLRMIGIERRRVVTNAAPPPTA